MGERAVVSSSYKDTISSWGTSLITQPHKPHHLPKGPPPNTVTLVVRASTHEFWWDTNIPSITPTIRKDRSKRQRKEPHLELDTPLTFSSVFLRQECSGRNLRMAGRWFSVSLPNRSFHDQEKGLAEAGRHTADRI